MRKFETSDIIRLLSRQQGLKQLTSHIFNDVLYNQKSYARASFFVVFPMV